MFWADEVVATIEKTYPGRKNFIIRDEKTPSGRVHVGSLRGVVIHGIVAQALVEKGYGVKYYYEFNDTDPMDGMPIYLKKEKYEKYMGFPLKEIPPPDKNGEPDEKVFQRDKSNNYARYFAREFEEVITRLGFHPVFYYNSELYADGKYDSWIDTVLECAEQIREVYKTVSGSEKSEDWNPVQIVCEQCGKVGTTTVIGFEGESGKKMVHYECEQKKVAWAVGCGYKGKVSPYRGRGKFPFKVEWAVKWQILPVHVEGAGKDHATQGGARFVAAGIADKVLKGTVPVDIPYEFFTFAGAKMSSSKAVGSSAQEVTETLPEVLLRFLMVRNRPERHIDFDPSGATMPRLYDFFDEAAEITFGRRESDIIEDVKRAFHFSQLTPGDEKDIFRPRFSRVAFLIQMPQLDFLEEVKKLKGKALTSEEKDEAERRAQYARKWLTEYASGNDKFEVQKEIPELAKSLSAEQRKFLTAIAKILQEKNWKGEELHAAIHDLRKKSPLTAQQGFQAIYITLLGKNSGPQVGWFLDALPHQFVVKRFQKVASLPEYKRIEIQDLVTSVIVIDKEVRERFPGIKLGFNILHGAKISKTHSDLQALREKLWSNLNFKELKGGSPRLAAFAEIYQAFGVNPNKFKPSPTALITRLANGKSLPHINVAVDIYNILVVKHQLSIGLFDLKKMKLPVRLAFAKGGEKFHGLGADQSLPLMSGELCYFDADGMVMARDFNYLDSELTKVDEKSTDILLNVDGNSACTIADVEHCLKELKELLVRYCGGELGKDVLTEAAV